MAPPKPTAVVDLGDGQQRTITFDFAVAWEFEDATGVGFDQIGDDDAGNLSAKNTAHLLAAMMREHDPDVDPSHVARHLHPGNMSDVMGKINEVMGSAQESHDDDEGPAEGEGERPSD